MSYSSGIWEILRDKFSKVIEETADTIWRVSHNTKAPMELAKEAITLKENYPSTTIFAIPHSRDKHGSLLFSGNGIEITNKMLGKPRGVSKALSKDLLDNKIPVADKNEQMNRVRDEHDGQTPLWCRAETIRYCHFKR